MSLRHAVLGLLADHPASGYDLMKLFETSLANVWAATQSQVYGELGKLSDGGLVAVTAEGPRGRKEYAITEDGKAELRHWLTGTPPTTTRRSDMLLRVFFLGRLTRLEAVTHLEAEAARAATRRTALKELEKSIDWDEGPLSVYGRIVLEYGVRQSVMQEEWARWAAERVGALDESADAPTVAAPPPGPEAPAP
ncbi:PadR family transcriptional regulator [Streptomyces sp. NA02950]|uniref:PadR family transcriptional regulator n=1 Tax=Streptomyces sp. NA02950 TaxID=2742137 RepID=UPI00159082B7|nr:PadR family transcriptional regulator [Streptomyces sp. NA02950]QKV90824.1 PadR family transcriptional regulator [Streptomyces sp. NA02950]